MSEPQDDEPTFGWYAYALRDALAAVLPEPLTVRLDYWATNGG